MPKTKTTTKKKIAARPVANAASRKPKASTIKSGATHKGQSVGDKEVSIDRRRGARRDQPQAETAVAVAAPPVILERRQKVNRRRQIDPTTCERDYTDQEVEFMNALDDYKRANGRMFPTCSEVLEVVRLLGYVKLSASELSAHNGAQSMISAMSIVSEEDDVAAASDWQ